MITVTVRVHPVHLMHADCFYLLTAWRYFCVFTARRSYASAVLGVVIILSVRPTVGLSVCHTCALWLIQRTCRRYFYTTWKGNPSSFLPPYSGWWATSSSTFNGRSKWPTPFKNRSRRQISTCNISTVRASEKSSIMMNGKSYTAFQRAVGEVRTLPLKSPKGWLKKRIFPFFGIKVNFSWMKSATKFLWEKSSSGTVIVRSFPCRTVHRCWGKH